MKILFGVIDLPYADSSYSEMGVRKPKGETKDRGISTGDVAEILENEYHIMEVFFELHGDFVADKLTDAMEGALENAALGAPVTLDPGAEAAEEIQQRFRQFIENKEMEGMGIPGVPTQAALQGHSKRFKNPYKRRKPRPSFRDTGLYVGAFRMWTEE